MKGKNKASKRDRVNWIVGNSAMIVGAAGFLGQIFFLNNNLHWSWFLFTSLIWGFVIFMGAKIVKLCEESPSKASNQNQNNKENK